MTLGKFENAVQVLRDCAAERVTGKIVFTLNEGGVQRIELTKNLIF